MASPWTIELVGYRLHVSLFERVRLEHVERLDARLRVMFGDDDVEIDEIIVFLDGIEGLSPKARYHLADVQRWISTCRVRTVYVSNRPLYRGVALWVAHQSDDFNARSFPTLVSAEHWFQTRDERPQVLRTRALTSLRLLEGAGQSKKEDRP